MASQLETIEAMKDGVSKFATFNSKGSELIEMVKVMES